MGWPCARARSLPDGRRSGLVRVRYILRSRSERNRISRRALTVTQRCPCSLTYWVGGARQECLAVRGTRSLTRTVTDRPVCLLTTLSRVPSGSARGACAAVAGGEGKHQDNRDLIREPSALARLRRLQRQVRLSQPSSELPARIEITGSPWPSGAVLIKKPPPASRCCSSVCFCPMRARKQTDAFRP